jgi:hypothetical protein
LAVALLPKEALLMMLPLLRAVPLRVLSLWKMVPLMVLSMLVLLRRQSPTGPLLRCGVVYVRMTVVVDGRQR